MAPQQTITQWLQGLAGPGVSIPWWSGRENGIAWTSGWGGYCDQVVERLKSATKVRFPDDAPADALPHLAGDSRLLYSQFETEQNIRTRIRTRWEDHERRGQPAEMLAQLYFAGWGGGVMVTQNGLAYSLSAAPTAGEDPTSLLTITTLGAAAAAITMRPTPQRAAINVSGSTASLSPAGAASTEVITDKTIPALTPWWTFDSRTDLCNRFALLYPNGAPATMTYGVATFDNTDTATVTWNNPTRFADADYMTLVGAPVFTSGAPPASVYEDFASRTATGTVIDASSTWTGYVFVIAFPVGENPFANAGEGDLNAARSIIKIWKPAATRCTGINVLVTGKFWGWPVMSFLDWSMAGGTWGGYSAVHFDAT